ISTAIGKQLYNSRKSRSETSISAASSAALPAMRAPGQPCHRGRTDTGTMWFDSELASGKTHLDRGILSSAALVAEQKSKAAAWSTLHDVACRFVYGNASIRLRSDSSQITASSTASAFQASGFIEIVALEILDAAEMAEICDYLRDWIGGA